MLFMIIEHFHDQNAKAVYARFKEKGRMAPEGLTYLDSWIEVSTGTISKDTSEIVTRKLAG